MGEIHTLRNLRKSKGVTIQMVAKWLGMSYEGYRKIEIGTTHLKHEDAIRLAHYYQVNAETIQQPSAQLKKRRKTNTAIGQ